MLIVTTPGMFPGVLNWTCVWSMPFHQDDQTSSLRPVPGTRAALLPTNDWRFVGTDHDPAAVDGFSLGSRQCRESDYETYEENNKHDCRFDLLHQFSPPPWQFAVWYHWKDSLRNPENVYKMDSAVFYVKHWGCTARYKHDNPANRGKEWGGLMIIGERLPAAGLGLIGFRRSRSSSGWLVIF